MFTARTVVVFTCIVTHSHWKSIKRYSLTFLLHFPSFPNSIIKRNTRMHITPKKTIYNFFFTNLGLWIDHIPQKVTQNTLNLYVKSHDHTLALCSIRTTSRLWQHCPRTELQRVGSSATGPNCRTEWTTGVYIFFRFGAGCCNESFVFAVYVLYVCVCSSTCFVYVCKSKNHVKYGEILSRYSLEFFRIGLGR